MNKVSQLKTFETFIRKNANFKNVSVNGEWINFSCLLAPYADEHRRKEDGSPSAGITIGKDGKTYYKCFTCKHQGPFSSTLERLEVKSKKDYSTLKKFFEDDNSLPDFELLYTTTIKERIKPEPLPFQNIFEDINEYVQPQRYLLDRNISLQTAKNIGLEYDPDSKRIVFPVRDRQGVTYGYTGRTIMSEQERNELPKDSPLRKKIKDYHFQKSQFILGVELWKPDQPVIIVEGLFAYAHLHEISKGRYFPYNIGAIMGSSISEAQSEILVEFAQPIYCLLDGDKAGITGTSGKKGLIRYTKDDIPTFILRYPKYTISVLGAPYTISKHDPDDLTFDELSAMLSTSLMVL
jgi:hypothetical protein